MNRKQTLIAIACVGIALIPIVGLLTASSLTFLIGAVTEHQAVTKSKNYHRNSYKVLTAKKIYGGSLVFTIGGFATDVIASADGFAGVSVVDVDNTGGASGALNVECYEDGRFLLTGSGFTDATLKKIAYASDNYTVTATAGSNVRIGTFDEIVSATKAWVMLEKHAA